MGPPPRVTLGALEKKKGKGKEREKREREEKIKKKGKQGGDKKEKK